MDVHEFTGLLKDGSGADDRYILNFPSLDRSFTGRLHHLTWEFEEGPCLYVGNRQAGHIYEVTDPNDGVIEELYSDYKVSSAFSEENYAFGLFDENRCSVPA